MKAICYVSLFAMSLLFSCGGKVVSNEEKEVNIVAAEQPKEAVSFEGRYLMTTGEGAETISTTIEINADGSATFAKNGEGMLESSTCQWSKKADNQIMLVFDTYTGSSEPIQEYKKGETIATITKAANDQIEVLYNGAAEAEKVIFKKVQ